jgi:hypothetical protein
MTIIKTIITFLLSTAFVTSLTPVSATYCTVSSQDKYLSKVNQYPEFSNELKFMASRPLAYWYTDRDGNMESAKQNLKSFVDRCGAAMPIVVIYGMPHKDCAAGESSSGFVKSDSEYEQFINNAKEVLPEHSLVVIEPDALALSIDNCGSSMYPPNLQKAVSALGGYLDIGHWKLGEVEKIKSLMKTINSSGRLKGYSLNLSNYRKTEELQSKCSALGMECIIDTSRNNNGPAEDGTWCNYKGAGIGMNDDTHIWIKPAAELDGNCYGSANSYQSNLGAGTFDINWLKLLWKQGYYANSDLAALTQSSSETTMPTPVPTPALTQSSPDTPVPTPELTQSSTVPTPVPVVSSRTLKICSVVQR